MCLHYADSCMVSLDMSTYRNTTNQAVRQQCFRYLLRLPPDRVVRRILGAGMNRSFQLSQLVHVLINLPFMWRHIILCFDCSHYISLSGRFIFL